MPPLQPAPGGVPAGQQAGQPRLGEDFQHQRKSEHAPWPALGSSRARRGRRLERAPAPRAAAASDRSAGSLQFEGSRGPEEIRKFWQNWEHPSINKQEWAGPELDRLKATAAKHGHLHWQKIAEELGVRTARPRRPGGCGHPAETQ